VSVQVILTPQAQADIRRLALPLRRRVLDKLAWIGENAEWLHHKALQGEEWAGCFRYRFGDYRIIYQLDWPEKRLIVLKIGHRRDVYR
jgi:mRNA interferase RelE/StbE